MIRVADSIKFIKQLYPVQLLLLAYAPLLIGYFIDPQLVEGRYLLINFIWLTLFVFPAALLRSQSIYRLIVLLYATVGFIEIGHWLILRGPVTITSILVSTNTNFQEALSFFDLKAGLSLFILIPYVILSLYALWKTPTYTYPKRQNYLGGLLFLAASVFVAENALNGRFIRKSTPQSLKVGLSYFDQRKLFKELDEEVNPRQVQVENVFGDNNQTFVLIIGESCNKNHMSLYGASRQTSPNLANREDILVFEDVVSPYSNTISSVLTILSESNLQNEMSFKNSLDVFDIFSSAGYETFWISNQSPLGIWENMITLFAKKADHLQFTNMVSNSSKESALTSSLDEKLFLPFQEALNHQAAKKLIIVHLMGSHSTYSKRYPPDFDIFEGANQKETLRAEYDNSIYYNDFIVDSMLNSMAKQAQQDSTKLSSGVYLADHGENVYDENDHVGHDFAGVMPKAHVEVPFIVWLSPGYKQSNEQKVNAMVSNLSKPFISDDLFHSILDLNGLCYENYQETRSIFNTAYDATRKRILEDGIDYDTK